MSAKLPKRFAAADLGTLGGIIYLFSTAAYGSVGMRLIDTNNSDIVMNLTP